MIDKVEPAVAANSSAAQQGTTAKHLRGSSLLLVGRLLAVALNFAVQVFTVRYLSKSDYGAFAYAVSVVALASMVAAFGMDKSISRFGPIYQEQRDYNKLFGTVIMMVGTMLSIGLAIVFLFFGLQGIIATSFINDQQALVLVLVMIALVPVQALDSLVLSMFANFTSPRAIFFRKHLLTPGLRLIVVLLLIWWQSDVFFLASGYLVTGILGLAIGAMLLVRVLREQGLFQHFNWKTIKMPAREVFGFTIPLLASDIVFILTGLLVVILLEYFRGTVDVAAFGAVLPIARLNNMVVLQSFMLLFTPMAARLFARNDPEGINDLYWQSAVWIAVVSFPIFVGSFSLARPLTVFLFGDRYEESAVILMWLALGHYFSAVLGFNGQTLRIFGRVRYIVVTDLLVAVTSVGANVLLIHYYGALGAAVGTCGTLIAQTLLYHFGLRFGTGVKLLPWHCLQVYFILALGALGLLLVQSVTAPPIYVSFVLGALVSALVILLNRRALNVAQTFPELLQFPLARRLFREKEGIA